MLVGVGATRDERDAAAQAARRILVCEQERSPPPSHPEKPAGVLLDLREIRRIVLDVQGHPELLDDLAPVVLERFVKAAYRLPAKGVVEPHRTNLLVPRESPPP